MSMTNTPVSGSALKTSSKRLEGGGKSLTLDQILKSKSYNDAAIPQNDFVVFICKKPGPYFGRLFRQEKDENGDQVGSTKWLKVKASELVAFKGENDKGLYDGYFVPDLCEEVVNLREYTELKETKSEEDTFDIDLR